MTIQNISLFQALHAKMDFLNQRQSVLAQNISNADTPGYKPHDLKPVDFGGILKNVTGQPGGALQPATTNAGHMGGARALTGAPKNILQKTTYETSPSGNAVIMEEQMVQSTQNMMEYNLATSLYAKNVALIRTAITGR